jgi:hypothetical protein
MSQDLKVVGKLESSTAGITVERLGNTVSLQRGDPVFWNDVIINSSSQAVEIAMPALSAGHGATLLLLSPNASAKLESVTSIVADGAERTEVVALSEGVELYDVDDDVSSAYLTPFEGEMSGLVGAGLLAAGSGAGAGVGVAIAGGVLGAVALSDDGDDTLDAVVLI